MSSLVETLKRSWDDLGREEQVAFSPAIAIAMVVYSAGASIAWYAMKGTQLSISLAQLGLGRARLVICLIWFGAFLFFGLVWAIRKTAPWRLRPETLVTIFAMA